MKVLGSALKVGDMMIVCWAGRSKMIIDFRDYTGTLSFVDRIADFADGTRQSIDHGRYYEIEEKRA